MEVRVSLLAPRLTHPSKCNLSIYEKVSVSFICLCLVLGGFRSNYMDRFRPQLHVQIALNVGTLAERV